MKAETVHFQITLVSPLHIGCGEEYEPMGFVVDEKNRELVTFQPADFLSRLSSNELERYSTICQQGSIDSILDLYKFMRQHSELAHGTRIGISEEFYNHYNHVLDKDRNKFRKEFQNFKIQRTFFNRIEREPVIPGSSIKGAIRTAVLNYRESRNPGKKKNYSGVRPWEMGRVTATESRNRQKILLGGTFSTDPFRLIKVSDFVPVEEVRRTIKYAVSFSKKNGEKKLDAMQEVIEQGSRFWGSITILPPPPGYKNVPKDPITSAEIINALRQFYTSEKEREDVTLQQIGVNPVNFISGHDAIPLRIGKHSGAESVTIMGHRQIKVSPPKLKEAFYKDTATTIWLSSNRKNPGSMTGLEAMGWVQLLPMSDVELKQCIKLRTEVKRQREAERVLEQAEKKRLKAKRKAEAEAAEQQRVKEEEKVAEEQAYLEKQRRQWKKMSEKEQDIAIIQGNSLAKKFAPTKDPVRDIWPKLERASQEHQKALANAFMTLWQQENKWNVNKKKKKQYAKVSRIKDILGLD